MLTNTAEALGFNLDALQPHPLSTRRGVVNPPRVS
jgi:hypothetical protein